MKNDFDQTKKPGARLQSIARVILEGREMLIPSAISRKNATKFGFIFVAANAAGKNNSSEATTQRAEKKKRAKN